MKTLVSALALHCLALTATAQTPAEPQFTSTCQDGNGWRNGGNQQFCETRDLAMAVPTGQPLRIEGGANGGITVHGWDGPNVRIRAKVTSWASTDAEAQARVQRVSIATVNGELRATSTDENERYAVSYEVFVPRQTALALNTLNGGIHLDHLLGDVKFHATNGGVSLQSLGGQVAGQTVNGGLNIKLSGKQWEGKGLDVETTNGGIHWTLPSDYSAQLFTSTNMGSIRANMPVTKSGHLRRELATTLGKGGPSVRAVTTNGGVTVEQLGRN
jgi:DUF4097 and DUF4098 domain-containing protein YvlB